MKKFSSFKDQLKFLTSVQQAELSLQDELSERKLSYDDLVYSVHEKPVMIESYVPIDEISSQKPTVPCVSFFSGAGGFDVGFEKAGFKTLACVEYEAIFCNTLRLNFPDAKVIGPPISTGDVKNKEEIFDHLRSTFDSETPFEGVFFGGPPCQPFSVAANQRFSKTGDNFKRTGFENEDLGNLLQTYVDYIIEFLPRVFVIENVQGLVDMDNGKGLSIEIKRLEASGYKVSPPKKVNVADYGIPQNRNRIFVVGCRDLDYEFSFMDESKQKINSATALLSKPIENCINHETRSHKVDSILRYCVLEAGKRDKLGRVDRLDPNKPSKTIIAGGKKGGGRSHLHPLKPRTLSVRECARLQTFPDDYEFTGSTARQFTQVGNAVPPLFAFKLATEIMNQVFKKDRKVTIYQNNSQLQMVMEK